MAAARFIWNEPAETMERGALLALQGERLRALAGYVYERSPFYRSRFDEYGVRPESIRGLGDLDRLPFTVKGDLRDNYPFGMLAVPREEVVRVQASSGTRGKLTVVAYTRDDIETWAEVCARSLALGGARPGDVVQNAYGYGLFTGGLGIHYGAETLGATVVPCRAATPSARSCCSQDLGAKMLTCTPSYALIIGEIMAARGRLARRSRSCDSASSAPSRGPRRCGWRSSDGWASTPSTSTA